MGSAYNPNTNSERLRTGTTSLLATQTAPPQQDLVQVHGAQLPPNHPVRIIFEQYDVKYRLCAGQSLPILEELIERVGRPIFDYCVVMLPVAGDPYIDFEIIHKGSKLPGAHNFGNRYTDNLLPKLANERLMELASCIALKSSRLTRAVSARPSTVGVKVYRCVMPVWSADCRQAGIVLAIAPIYADVTDSNVQ